QFTPRYLTSTEVVNTLWRLQEVITLWSPGRIQTAATQSLCSVADALSTTPMNEKDLIKVTFHRASTGEYHCPVLYKPLTNTSHVVAVKTTGHTQLNIKVNNWRELLTDKPFTRNDLIIIQDSQDLTKFNISKFIMSSFRCIHETENVSRDTQQILEEFNKTYTDDGPKEEAGERVVADKFNAKYKFFNSLDMISDVLTSLMQTDILRSKAAVLEDDVLSDIRGLKKRVMFPSRKFGYIELEVYCYTVPKPSRELNKSVSFIQGGDQKVQAKVESPFGEPSRMNFGPTVHKGRGVLSMANSGTDTN
ncbi:RING-type E3 ubiquitin-protein ligase PPIL2-like, partial [Penaeus indicus]|uniref:RING-type E3 ubiquitin-protein ligase PPIL2-like n=1 Tax=Penaeus indicus TaxID=29960 RepID=UPI00300D8D25